MELREYVFKYQPPRTPQWINDFCEKCNISRNTFYSIKGKRVKPFIETAKRIEKATNGEVTVAELRGKHA